MRDIIFFTDMDGTLLDHYTYSFEPVKQTLLRLHDNRIPVIANTSKTFLELLDIRSNLGNTDPFIFENGAAIALPSSQFSKADITANVLPNLPVKHISEKNDYFVIAFVGTREQWLEVIQSVSAPFAESFLSFSQISVEKISELTGLNYQQATLSSQRMFGEPVYWQGDESQYQAFCEAARNAGATVLKGGRFTHICGETNKGQALIWLAQLYAQKYGKNYLTIGLGDGDNDIAMLESVNFPVIISSPVHNPPVVAKTHIHLRDVYITKAQGPEGWSEASAFVLADIEEHF